ncbi:MAG: UDP-glucuronic acid decarboxylase family protein [Parachlamydiales bacterium]|jgi:UDP-glucuronate decarboxylase
MRRLIWIVLVLVCSLSVMEGKRVLVTGGAGFLGSHLCERLYEAGNEVICADNLYTGSLRNISHLIGKKGFQFIQHDVEDPFSQDLIVDEVYNLACPASPPHYQRDPIKTLRTNVIGAINVLELAKRSHAKIFQASTSEVYGDPLEHPQKETYWGNVNPDGIRSCYDEGKRCAETLFFDYQRLYGVNIKVGRIFNTYGPKMNADDGRVVSNFIVQALENKPITIYGDGQQTRSFCYVDDLVDVILLLMDSPDGFHGPVNIGNPNEFTVKELALKVLAMTGSTSEIISLPLPLDDPKVRNPDISLARRVLNWEPKFQLEDGLKSTIEYFRASLAKPS